MTSGLLDRLWILGCMGMLRAAIDLEFTINRAAEAVVRDHSLDGLLDEQLRASCATLTEGFGLMSSDETGKAHVSFLGFLLSPDLDIAGVDDNDEITGVDMSRVDCLVLAAQEVRCLDGDVTQMLVLGVNDPPTAFDFGCFCGKCLHSE